MNKDEYRTIEGSAEAVARERSSKFYAFAYHVKKPEEVKEIVDGLKKKYFDATHHCYAYRIGYHGETFRANDDGEPSGTAGKPILGQLLAHEITNCLIVVVRYFGGTKLGVPGLIAAYKESANNVLECSQVVEKTVDVLFEVKFSYVSMNEVMRVVKDFQPKVIEQQFDNVCVFRLAIRESRSDQMKDKLSKIEGASIVII